MRNSIILFTCVSAWLFLIELYPLTETQCHVLFLMNVFYWYDTLAILIWGWGDLYEVKPEIIRSDEDCKVTPLDIVKWLLRLKV